MPSKSSFHWNKIWSSRRVLHGRSSCSVLGGGSVYAGTALGSIRYRGHELSSVHGNIAPVHSIVSDGDSEEL